MKIFIALVVCCGVISFVHALADEELDAMKTQILEGCMAQEGATADDIKPLLEHQEPNSRGGRCALACIMEVIGVVRNGKSSLEGKIGIAKMMHPGNAESIEIAKNTYYDCKDISTGDRCDYAVDLAKCSIQSLARQGIDIKDHV